MHTPDAQALSDWEEVKGKIEARAPDIEVRIANNVARNSVTRRWQVSRPSLVFSPGPLREYRPPGGKIYAGRPMSKERELRQLREAGIPVPETAVLAPDLQPPRGWGEFIVVKPFHGHSGKRIRLVSAEELLSRHAELTDGGRLPMLAQPYVDNSEADKHNVWYRVLTLFGRELCALVNYVHGPRRPLDALAADATLLGQLKPEDWIRELSFDEAVIGLARSVEPAFPEIPVLGVDVVRDAGTGRLYVMECHPSGLVWHLSSSTAERFLSHLRRDSYEQFAALDLTAELLIEKTRAEAR